MNLLINRRGKPLPAICAMIFLAGGCATRTASNLTPQPAVVKSSPLSDYIRGVYKLSSEATKQLEQRATLLADAPELADLVDRVEQDPTDADARMQLISEYMSRKLYWGAYELLTNALPAGVDDPEINLNLASIWDAWGLYDLALQYGERAIVNGATSAKAYETMGRIQLHRRQSTEALSWYSRSWDSGGTASVLANMGYAHMLGGEWDSARSRLEEAIALDDSLEEAHNNLAFVLSKTGDDTGALARLLRTGRPAVAFNNIGVLHLQEKRLNDAEHYFEEALRLEPDYEIARRNLMALQAVLPLRSIIRLPASVTETVNPPQTVAIHLDGTRTALAPVERETPLHTDVTVARSRTEENAGVDPGVLQQPSKFRDQANPTTAILAAAYKPATISTTHSPTPSDRAQNARPVREGSFGVAGFAGLVVVTGFFALLRRASLVRASKS